MEQSPSWKVNRFSASQKIPRILRNPNFITALASARHLSLSWASSVQSISVHPTFWRSILILSFHLRLGSQVVSFPQVCHQNPAYASLLPICFICAARLILLDFIIGTKLGEEYRLLTFRHRASPIYDRRFATLQTTPFIYLINKYISLSDICLTVHHWYK